MKENGFRCPPSWEGKRCPYCYEKLGKMVLIKRNIKKTCVCKSCGVKIDERHIFW